MTVVSDPVGDEVGSQGAAVSAVYDITSVSVAEPCSIDGLERLVFTLKVAGAPSPLSGKAPPDSVWYITFAYRGVTYFAGLSTWANGAPQPAGMVYGRVDANPTPLPSSYTLLGGAEDGSAFFADGTIRVVLAKWRLSQPVVLGDVSNVAPQPSPGPGDVLSNLSAVAGLSVSAPGTLFTTIEPLDSTSVGSYALAPVGTCSCAAPNPCALPGVRLWSDATGDAFALTNPPEGVEPSMALPQYDTQGFSIAEAMRVGPTFLPSSLVFTLKMASLANLPELGSLPPDSSWGIFFDAPSGRFYVDMETDASGAASFNYGTLAATPGSSTRTRLGPLDLGSGFAADGTITMVVTRAKLGGLQVGEQVKRVFALVQVPGPPVCDPSLPGSVSQCMNALGDAAPDSRFARDASPASYMVLGNGFCDQPPAAALTALPASGNAPLSVSLSGTASWDPDSGDSIGSYTFDFGDGTPPVTQTSATIDHTYGNVGAYIARLTVADASFGKTSAATAGVYAINRPPVASLAGNATAGNTPLVVTFDGIGSFDPDPADTIASYIFDFGDGSPAVVQATSTVSHTYNAVGVFAASLTVKDNHNLGSVASANWPITISNRAPVASLSASPASGYIGLTVTLDGTGSTDPDAGDAIASYRFDFGDGSPVVNATASVKTHTYDAVGTYTASLTVTDSHGLVSTTAARRTITIDACAGPAMTSPWRQLGPAGGFVTGLVMDSQSPATLYATSFRGGLFKTTDGGQGWTAINEGLAGTEVSTVVINPAAPSTLYAATWGRGILKSTNRGGNWTKITSGLKDSFVTALMIDARQPETLYAAEPTQGLFKSVNGGDSWTLLGSGLARSGVGVILQDPVTFTTLYAGTSGGVGKSVDGGVTWTYGGMAGSAVEITGLVIDPVLPATLYASTYRDGVFKTTDGGMSWAAINNGLSDLFVRALKIDPANPGRLYAGTWSEGIFRSLDGGASWNSIGSGAASRSVWALAIDPQASSSLYAATGGGVLKSTDSGGTWRAANSGLHAVPVTALVVDPVTPSNLYMGSDPGLWKSSDGGFTWAAATSGMGSQYVASLAIDPQRPSTLYALADQTYKSTDSGDHWSALPGVGGQYLLAVDPIHPANLYLGTFGNGVYRSTDEGDSWAGANGGLTKPYILAIITDPVASGNLYAYGMSHAGSDGLFRSTDGGASWAESDSPSPRVVILAVDPQMPTTLYGGTYGGGVWRSTDSGAHWDPAGVIDLLNPVIGALAVHPQDQGTVYAGAVGGGVFGTFNGGACWSSMSNGLLGSDINALSFDPAAPSRLYAGTAGNSVAILRQDVPTSFHTLTPCRVVDTRSSVDALGGPAMLANTSRAFALSGHCGVPANALALSLNVTVTGASAAGELKFYAPGEPIPATTTIVFAPGKTRANNAVVGVGSGASLVVFDNQASGTAHLILDVNGYFAP